MNVRIDQPCSENWNKMTPEEKGRFCGKCQKSVVDFTRMRDHEIVDFLTASSGNVCGP
jgi:hypothetical protein